MRGSLTLRGPFVRLWLLCGALDALYATLLSMLRGSDVAAMWRGVAAGPFGDHADQWGLAGALAGLAVHFAIMAVMIAAGIWLARRTMLGEIAPWKAGTLFGLIAYGVMYGLVLPARFGVSFPNPDRIKLALGLFPHIFLVGLPIFYLVRKRLQPS